jgi:sterol desaturase/sphingolipid hydroxylase (fatty acid hydroxylase superfamily)
MIEILSYLTIGLIPAFILLDWAVRGRKHDSTRYWRLRATAVTVANFFIAGYVATFWGTLFGEFHLFDLSTIGTVGSLVVGILVYELGHYGYHRMAHSHDWLWRMGHQMHHSAESLDAFGANYLSPLDAFMFTSISSVVFFPLLGVTVEAGVIAAAFLAFNAVFQHANIKTPRWLGYLIQRPESHSLHHGRGVHAHNYADLPLVDMIFGTFVNPKDHRAEVGFYDGASAKLGSMLMGKDMSLQDEEENVPPVSEAA